MPDGIVRLDLKTKLTKRHAALETERSTWQSHWEDISRFCFPRGSRFLVTDYNRGEKKNENIVRNTGGLALRTLMSGMMGGITSPSRPWFRLTVPDPELGEFWSVRRWLSDVERRMREVFQKSNLYNTLPANYRQMGAYGQGALSVLDDDEDVIRTVSFPTGSYCIATNDRGVVDSFYRRFTMTVAQLYRKFGEKACSETVRALALRGSWDTAVNVVHVIEPNDERIFGKEDSVNKPFRSCYYEPDQTSGLLLRLSGYEMFPVLCPRWDITGEDVYGFSPAMDALGDIKGLQLEQKRKMQAIDVMVRPPWLMPAALKNSRQSMLPGDVVYVDTTAGQQAKPLYEINPRVEELMLDMRETEEIINRAFYADLFLMLANDERRQPPTAEEIVERRSEKLLALGPVLERLNDEKLDPLIDLTFAYMQRRGMIPTAPKEIEGMDLRVEYISIMAQAQKMVGTSSLERLINFTGAAAKINPNAVDKVDFDEGIEEYGDMLGVSPKVILSKEEVDKRREARGKLAQAQQVAAMAPAMKDAAGAVKDMSQADMTQDSALSRMTGLTGAAAGG